MTSETPPRSPGPRRLLAAPRRRAAAVVILLAAGGVLGLGFTLRSGRAQTQPLPIPVPVLSSTTAATTPPPTTAAEPPTSEATAATPAPSNIPASVSTDTSETTETTVEDTSTVEPAGPEGVAAPGTPSSTTTVRPRLVGTPVAAANVSAAVTGSYGLAVGAVLLVAITLFGLAIRATSGGPLTPIQRRWRLAGGLACLAAAAIIGIVGYLRLSLEPAVNRQIPYLASAGMALVLLSAVGGSLLVAEQLRSDDGRLDELEAAVRALADTLAPMIEAPPRNAAVDANAADTEKGGRAAKASRAR